ncbi:MAG: hypothetical protein SF182_24000 [Deltaproteobacteria bacterium]|nr:hypothetical protein [Deltaproteobacteria bacterium]
MGRRSIALAVLLALALFTAPMRVALRSECDLCPPDCPMHRAEHGHGEAPAGASMKCHNAPAAKVADATHGKLPRLSRPPCGTHGAMQGLALAPVILPDAVAWRVMPDVRRTLAPAAQPHARGVDPPDTPPPILHA